MRWMDADNMCWMDADQIHVIPCVGHTLGLSCVLGLSTLDPKPSTINPGLQPKTSTLCPKPTFATVNFLPPNAAPTFTIRMSFMT